MGERGRDWGEIGSYKWMTGRNWSQVYKLNHRSTCGHMWRLAIRDADFLSFKTFLFLNESQQESQQFKFFGVFFVCVCGGGGFQKQHSFFFLGKLGNLNNSFYKLAENMTGWIFGIHWYCVVLSPALLHWALICLYPSSVFLPPSPLFTQTCLQVCVWAGGQYRRWDWCEWKVHYTNTVL